MRLFGLIGYPLSHSFSARYFKKKFEQEGISDCRYELFPLKSIDELPSLLNQQEELLGLNVTIPYKKQVIPFLHSAQYLPAGLDACNCIRIIEKKLFGYNTDIIAFEKSIRPLLKFHHSKALVLGNGGAASAVCYSLRQLGIEFHIVSRNIHEGSTLTYRQLTREIVEESKVIINTTPLGMHPQTESFPPIPYEYLGSDHILYDLVYNPAKTEFLKKGEQRGAMIKNGLEMLELQAEESWRIWNNEQSL